MESSSSLFCAEDVASWDDVDGVNCDDADDNDSGEWAPPPTAYHQMGQHHHLVAAEADQQPSPDYLPRLRSRSLDPTARQDAINWILKLKEFYRFRPVTASLAVSYLDRFLSSNSLPAGGGGGGWAMQLVSVACVSVAAKMEETHVPLLLDLQILDPRYVFEPLTVRRMELLLMSALRWRMRAVTPFDFLDPLSSLVSAVDRASLLAGAGDLIISTHRVLDFLTFRPSAIAAAALLCAASGIDGCSLTLACFHDWVNKDVVIRCCQLMEEYVIDTCPSAVRLKAGRRSELPAPQSPVGVLDAAACGSCDSQKSITMDDDVDEKAEPPFKRCRLGG